MNSGLTGARPARRRAASERANGTSDDVAVDADDELGQGDIDQTDLDATSAASVEIDTDDFDTDDFDGDEVDRDGFDGEDIDGDDAIEAEVVETRTRSKTTGKPIAKTEKPAAKAARTDPPERTPRRGPFSRSSTKVERWEQIVAYVLAAAILVADIYDVVHFSGTHESGTALRAGIGGLFGIALAVAAYSRRRLPTAFSALIASFLLPQYQATSWLNFACVIFAGIVIFRSSNEAARKAGEERRARRQAEKAEIAAGGGSRSASGRRPPAKRGAKTSTPAGPTANKRYTPPKPKPKPRPQPEPSGRKRAKAAATDDEG